MQKLGKVVGQGNAKENLGNHFLLKLMNAKMSFQNVFNERTKSQGKLGKSQGILSA